MKLGSGNVVSSELRFWKSVEELRDSGETPIAGGRDCLAGLRAQGQQPAAAHSRRDFLTLAGFTLTAAALSSCSRGREMKAIPFLRKPEDLMPGVANWYATTCGGCAAGCSLLVKTRDGRPIKIEGNSESALFGSGTCAVGQATVLSLYDQERLRGPLWQGRPISWEEIDARIGERLAAAGGGPVRIALISRTILGPATRDLIAQWSARPGFQHVAYDPVSFAALRQATREAFGVDGLPHYRFAHARTIVGIEADFLGTWLSPVEFTRDYASRRRPEPGTFMSRHIQFESGVSLTGSNADSRVTIAPSQQGLVALALWQRVARKQGMTGVPDVQDSPLDGRALDAAADDLWRDRGESLVVCGSQDPQVQLIVHHLNVLLGNIGHTVDLDHPSRQKQGDDAAVARVVDEMSRGDIDVLILYGVNPGYDYPEAGRFLEAMKKVPLSVSFADRLDETAACADAVCPDHHFLEAWGDAEPVASFYSLAQPTIAPLFDTRSAQDSLLKWLGRTPDFYQYLREFWRTTLYPQQDRYATFDDFWDHSLHDGVFATPRRTASAWPFVGDSNAAAAGIQRDHARTTADARADRYELHLYETVGLRDGTHANNPWLQELPDPVTKITWGNYAAIAPSFAVRLGVTSGDVIALEDGGWRVELPVHVQPGQSADDDFRGSRIRPDPGGQGRPGRWRERVSAGRIGGRPAALRPNRRARDTHRPIRAARRDPDPPFDGRTSDRQGRRPSRHFSCRGHRATTIGSSSRRSGPSVRAASTSGAWPSISTRAPAARRASPPARRRTTCRSSGKTKCGAAARCTGYASIATTRDPRTTRTRSCSR